MAYSSSPRPQQDQFTASRRPEQAKCLTLFLRDDTSSAPSHTRLGTECLPPCCWPMAHLQEVRSGPGLRGWWHTGTGGPCYVLRLRVRRSTQLRRRRPAMPCRVRTQEGEPVGLVKRLEGGGRMNGATMEPGYTLILQASCSQPRQLAPKSKCRFQRGAGSSESESILESSSVIFSRRFSLSEGHRLAPAEPPSRYDA